MTPTARVVHPPCGPLRGGTTAAGISVFRGIPYAAPPVGELRWRPPAPAPRWSGVRDALAFGPDFPQAANARFRATLQDEDCLYLNVWAPSDAPVGSLPVMVWVHGGGFTGGSGADARSDGERLASHGVVVVSFNYRSGLFGFLAHPSLSHESAQGTSGNYGLLDQLAALRWVGDNIGAFGGDPGRVCVFGVSAGSASIALLLTSPPAAGLFHSAALHSPGAGRPLATLAEAERAGSALGQDLPALRALPARDLLGLTGRLNPAVRGLTTPRVLRPILDGWLLPDDERSMLKAGRIRPMPLLVGSNADEGTLLTRSWPVDSVGDWRGQVAANFAAAQPEAEALYPCVVDQEARRRVGEMFADTQFNYGTRLLAQSMAAREQRTWRYLFTRRAPGQRDGPHHGEEVSYVFGNLAQVPGADAVDERISEGMRRAWSAFARSGDPNAAGTPAWPRYVPEQDNHLEFGDSVRTGFGWRRPQLDFLDRYYELR